MKGKILPICPLCDEEIVTDLSSMNYCKLCGMGIGIGRQLCHGCEARMMQ